MELSHQAREAFLETLWTYFAEHGRTTLPWRLPKSDGTFDPYAVMVSELMLQQTQVSRVIPKYLSFLSRFPNVNVLARAELGDVLREWQGLGYNRRAKFLWQAAQKVSKLGSFPDTLLGLTALPGIGTNTAGAILAYAYNQPVVFIETNVRTVFIYHFFADQDNIHDTQILELVMQTVDQTNPREFYWAIMDYGSHLKTAIGNPNKASKHYVKQSAFQGSRRQIRGQVLKELGSGAKTITQLKENIHDERLLAVLNELISEGMIRALDGAYSL